MINKQNQQYNTPQINPNAEEEALAILFYTHATNNQAERLTRTDIINLAPNTWHTPDIFKIPANQKLATILLRLHEDNKLPDPTTAAPEELLTPLCHALENGSYQDATQTPITLESIGGYQRLIEIITRAPYVGHTLATIQTTLNTLRQERNEHQQRLAIDRYNTSPQTKKDLLELTAQLETIRDRQEQEQRENAPRQPLADWYKQQIINQITAPFTPITTGISSLDTTFRHLAPASVIFIGARPGVGKTALACTITAHLITHAQHVIFVTAEMSKLELCHRITATVTGMHPDNLAKRYKTETDPATKKTLICTINEALKHISPHLQNITFIEAHSKTLDQITPLIRSAHAENPATLLIIDYTQRIAENTPGTATAADKISDTCNKLFTLAKKLSLHTIALAQLNREAVTSKNPKTPTIENTRPTMEYLKGSGAIEQNADMVLLLHRLTLPNTDKTTAELIISKDRNGDSTGKIINLSFNGPKTCFTAAAQNITE